MPKRKQYSIEFKLSIVNRIRNGEQQTKVAREIGVAESTVRGWKKEEDKLKEFILEVDTEEGRSRKRAKTAADPVLDKATWSWFVQERAAGASISTESIKVQATKFHQQLHGSSSDTTTPFMASNGWASRFTKRHGIRCYTQQGEVKSADAAAAADFIPTFQSFIQEEGLQPAQIFNADETGLYYRQMGNRTLAHKDDPKKHQGAKEHKERVTLLLCGSMDGHKLKPLAIGKFQSPRCFHHLNMNRLPVVYRHSKNAWMTCSIFEEWFKKIFCPAVRRHLQSLDLEERAILLLDNCPAHPPAEQLRSSDGKIKVLYLPKNTTSLIQPMDQGVNANFKIKYRGYLKAAMIQDPKSPEEFLKSLNLKDAFHLVGKAWDDVKSSTVKNCFIKGLGPIKTPTTTSEDSDDDEDFEGFTQEEVEAAERKVQAELLDPEGYAQVDSDCQTSPQLSEEEILITANNTPSDEEEEEEEESQPPPKKVSYGEAVDACQLLVSCLEQEEDGDNIKLLQMQAFLDYFKKKRSAGMKQRTLLEMFNPK